MERISQKYIWPPINTRVRERAVGLKQVSAHIRLLANLCQQKSRVVTSEKRAISVEVAAEACRISDRVLEYLELSRAIFTRKRYQATKVILRHSLNETAYHTSLHIATYEAKEKKVKWQDAKPALAGYGRTCMR